MHGVNSERKIRRFVERDGLELEVGGEPYRIDGCNTYYLMVYAADPDLRGHVDAVLDGARAMGLNTVRTWAFNDGAGQWNALQTAPGGHEERILQGLDYVVEAAGQRGLRLILPFVNYWPDYGGMDQYVAWSPTARRRDDFYDDPWCERVFRDHIRTLAERENTRTGLRYRDDPTILAWELANEPRCPSDPGGWRLHAWIARTAAYVKSLDPNHLVSVGLEGFFGGWSDSQPVNPPRWPGGQGTDFVWHHEPEAVDLATFHLYPDHWWMHPADGIGWIREHVRLARRTLGKPVVLEEFGKRGSASVRERCFRAWADAGRGLAGTMFWALYHPEYPDYDGFGVYPGSVRWRNKSDN